LTYEKLLKKNNKLVVESSQILNSFIDSSDIYNKNGRKNIGYGYNPKKQTKISAICDENKTILSIDIILTINKLSNNKLKKVEQLTNKEKNDNKVNKKDLNKIANNNVIEKIQTIILKK
jgi:hypothetical protein